MLKILYIGENNIQLSQLQDSFDSPLLAEYLLESVSTLEAACGLLSPHYGAVFIEGSLLTSDFVQLLRESEWCLPVIALLEDDTFESTERALAWCVVDHLLATELDTRHLSRAIRYALRLRESWLSLRDERLKHSERKVLDKAQHLLSSIVESSQDSILTIDFERHITSWNYAAEELYGYTAAEVLGKHLTLLTLPEDLHQVLTNVDRIKHSQTVEIFDTIRLNKDGREMDLEVVLSPVKDRTGQVIGVSTIARDITKRKQVEENLRQSEERYRTFIAATSEAIWRLDLEQPVPISLSEDEQIEWFYRYSYLAECNDTMAQMYGLDSSQEMVGSRLGDLLVRSDPANIEYLRAFIRSNYRLHNAESHEVGAQGQTKYFLNNLVGMVEKGALQRSWGTQRDITEQKLAEATLLESEARFRTAIAEAPVPIMIHREDGKVLQISKGWTKYSGYELKDVSTIKDWVKCAYGEASPEAHEYIKALYQVEETSDEGKWTITAKDGQKRIWDFITTPLGTFGDNQRVIINTAFDITERMQDEVALRHSEERYRSLTQATAQIVWTASADGMMNDMPIWREFTGQSSEEVRGRGWAQALHPSDRERIEKSTGGCLEIGIYEDEYRVRAANGDYRLFAVRGVPVYDDDGSVREWVGTFTDVHDRRQAEEERDRFFTISLDMLTIIGSDGYMKRLNPAWEATLGFSNAELMAVPFLEFVHPDDRAATMEEDAKLIQGGKLMRFENRYRCSDGSYKWLLWMCASFEDLIYCVAHDVTAMRNAEAALRKANDELELRVAGRTVELEQANVALKEKETEQQRVMATLTQSEERFRLLVESVHDYAILMMDTTGHILTWNAGAERMNGYRSEEIIGKHFSCFYTEEDRQAGKPEQELTTAASEGYLDDEGWRVRSDGSQFWATLVITALRDEAGQLRGFAKITRDITERKNVEAALREAKAQADSANLAKSEFLSRMSHELRTPLNAILGFGQILEGGHLTPLQHESVNYILKGGRHLLGLINEVLDIARVEAGGAGLSIEPVALHDVVPEACDLVRPLAMQRGIRLEQQFKVSGDPHVFADRQRLKQVLINLLSNAIKYNHHGGQVTVICEAIADERIRIGVRDTGSGISSEDLPKLFTAFERLSAINSDIEGTGLGLVLSQRLVSAMGGTLHVESIVGQGSTFSIELESAMASEIESALLAESITRENEVQDDQDALAHRYKVLCIEDNLSNLRLIEMILTSRPAITLISAVQGRVGIDLACQHEPDLILLDLHLPDISGHEVLIQLQRMVTTSHIPIIVISADATKQQIHQIERAGVLAYLTKPLDVTQFLDLLDEVLPAYGSVSEDS